MFTGIVEEVGEVQAVQATSLRICARKVLTDTKNGDSVAVNGVCLTVTALDASSFSVDVMPETLRRSNLGLLRRGGHVNLERASALGGHLGGHLVQGHVDSTGKVVSMVPEDNAVLLKIAAPASIIRFLVEKAFIAVDGASLTVAQCDATSFTVSVVGYTLHNTTIGSYKTGQPVNLEVDILAKYVEHFMLAKSRGITMDFLAEHGFSTSR
ncbi:MAG: riboflavin synthase [Chloroflexi bacterium]|nr:riboflavin synthase [Chloroflexota bacterium]